MKFDKTDEMIINLILKEFTNEEIAEKTGYSLGYVKKRIGQLLKKFNVKSKVGLAIAVYGIFCLEKQKNENTLSFSRAKSTNIHNNPNKRKYTGGTGLISGKVRNLRQTSFRNP